MKGAFGKKLAFVNNDRCFMHLNRGKARHTIQLQTAPQYFEIFFSFLDFVAQKCVFGALAIAKLHHQGFG
jgi:hypothetical protein